MAVNIGPRVIAEITRQDSTLPLEARLPVSYPGWEHAAKEILPPGVFAYIACGAGAGQTMAANRAAFTGWRILPRALAGVAERDIGITLFGRPQTGPLVLASAGNQGLIDPEGDLASARAAASLGLPFALSTLSSYSIEQVAQASGEGTRWFQLYWGKDYDILRSLVGRAEKAGYAAIVLTIDNPLPGWRPCDLHYLYPPLALLHPIVNYLSDPVFLAKLPKPPAEDYQGAVQRAASLATNPALSWDDLPLLKSWTRLPVLLKGIMAPEDARRALDYGVGGLIVSNHGGRHLDGAQATLDALPAVVSAVWGRVPVLMDSGIRHGADVIKALALGAAAVLVGRPFLYGLAVAGEAGVRRAMQSMLAQVDFEMGNAGRRMIGEIDRTMLVRGREGCDGVKG